MATHPIIVMNLVSTYSKRYCLLLGLAKEFPSIWNGGGGYKTVSNHEYLRKMIILIPIEITVTVCFKPARHIAGYEDYVYIFLHMVAKTLHRAG